MIVLCVSIGLLSWSILFKQYHIMPKFFLPLVLGFAVINNGYAQTTDDEKFEQAEKYHQAKDYKKAFPLFKELADKGNAAAQRVIGIYYHNGYSPEGINLEKAYEWYKMAADNNDIIAISNIGGMYRDGEYVEQSDDKAYEFYLRAAQMKGSHSVYPKVKLACMFWDGYGETTDETGRTTGQSIKQAEKWFREAAKQDNAYGMYWLARFYDFNWGDDLNNNAIELYEKAASNGSPEAQAVVGFNCFLGEDYKKATDLLTEARKNGATRVSEAADINIPIDLAIMLCGYFAHNRNYTFYTDEEASGKHIYVFPQGDNCYVTPKNNYIYVAVTKEGKQGFIKLSLNGKVLGMTPIKYEGSFYSYDDETETFRYNIGWQEDGKNYLKFDITGKEDRIHIDD